MLTRSLAFAGPVPVPLSRGAPAAPRLTRRARPLPQMSLGVLSYFVGPKVLNTPSSSPPPPSPSFPSSPPDAAALRTKIQDLYVAHVSLEGVDYAGLRSSPAFTAYLGAAASLASTSPAALPVSDDEKVAFFVNLYNAIVIHAFTALGPPAGNSVARLLFNNRASYSIAGYVLSLSEIENGVLRRNQGIAIWPAPFRAGDDRLRLAVDTPDARIHFVLNCGANSCPPIRFLTAEGLEDDLALATEAFLAQDDNLRVEVGDDGVVVWLSAIFKWYQGDFAGAVGGEGEDGVLKFVGQNAGSRNSYAEALAKALEGGREVEVKYVPYDWTLNDLYKSAN